MGSSETGESQTYQNNPAQCMAERLQAGGDFLIGAGNLCTMRALRKDLPDRIGICGRMLRLVADGENGDIHIQPDLGSPPCAVSNGTAVTIETPATIKNELL